MRQSWTDDRLDGLNEKVDQRFDQVDQRFEQVDQRFDQVDQRFDRVGPRRAESKATSGRVESEMGCAPERMSGFDSIAALDGLAAHSAAPRGMAAVCRHVGLIATQL